MGLKLKVPKPNISSLQLVLFGVLCMGIGGIITLFVMIHQETSRMGMLVKQHETQVEVLIETIEYLRTWKGLVDDRFREQEGAIQRVEFMMQIPKHARTDAATKYDAFNADEQKE